MLDNCKNFMREEGYTEADIARALQVGNHEQLALLRKGLCRMQHYNSELYTVPKMFDRWRQFVHLRKLFKHWSQFVDKRSEYIKCDLAQFFDRWRKYDSAQKQEVRVLNKKQLD